MFGSGCLIHQRPAHGLSGVSSNVINSHGMRTVTARKSSAIRESLAEGTHACLALIAVVLLARAQSGALDRVPSAGVVIPISLLIWAATAMATSWNPPLQRSWFATWRSCVSPTLIVLICGGRGSVSLLLGELAITAVGIAAVGYLAYQFSEPVAEPTRFSDDATPVPPLDAPAPIEQAAPSLPPAPLSAPESVTAVSPVPSDSGNHQRLDSAHDGVELHLASPQPESEEPLRSSESPDAESWTRREFEGEVSIEAVVFARFSAGSKLAVLHLPFVPPLPEVPQIDFEPLDSGCDVTITTESAFRHGAKLNVTRRSTGPAESIPIGIVIYTSVEEEIES